MSRCCWGVARGSAEPRLDDGPVCAGPGAARSRYGSRLFVVPEAWAVEVGRRTGRSFLADEGAAQGVVGLRRVEEDGVHPGELVVAVGGERPVRLVAFPPCLLGGDAGLEGGGRRQAGGECGGPGGEVLRGAVDGPVHQTDPLRGRRGDRQGPLGEPRGGFGADPRRQGVGPVLRAVQPHQPVVGVEHHGRAAPDLIGGEGQHDPAGRGVAAERRDHPPVRRGQDGLHEVIHRVDVGPGLLGGVGRGLDDVQVDAVGEEVAAAAEDQHGGRP